MRSKRAIADAEVAAARAEVAALVSRAINVSTIERLRSDMLDMWGRRDVNYLGFKAAQQKLAALRDDLAGAGVECRALDLAISANVNRRNRDRDDLLMPLDFFACDALAFARA